jgi:hypothetical protein
LALLLVVGGFLSELLVAEGVVLLLFLLPDLLVAHRLGGFRLDLLVLGFGRDRHGVGFFWRGGDLLQHLRGWGHEVAADVLDVGERQHVGEGVLILRDADHRIAGPELLHDHFLLRHDHLQGLEADGVGAFAQG